MSKSRNKLVVPNAQNAIDNMKWEIASEAAMQSQAENMAEFCGSIGGQITKNLVELGEEQLKNQNK